MLGTVSVIHQSLLTQHTIHSFACAVHKFVVIHEEKKHDLTVWNRGADETGLCKEASL